MISSMWISWPDKTWPRCDLHLFTQPSITTTSHISSHSRLKKMYHMDSAPSSTNNACYSYCAVLLLYAVSYFFNTGSKFADSYLFKSFFWGAIMVSNNLVLPFVIFGVLHFLLCPSHNSIFMPTYFSRD